MDENNLEARIRRLELLHLYGFFAITIFGLGYIIYNRKKR
jgi:hypothetical protein